MLILWCVSSMALEVGRPGYKFQLYHFLAKWIQASYLTSLSLSFIICKMESIEFWGFSKIINLKHCAQYLVQIRHKEATGDTALTYSALHQDMRAALVWSNSAIRMQVSTLGPVYGFPKSDLPNLPLVISYFSSFLARVARESLGYHCDCLIFSFSPPWRVWPG